MILQSKFVCLFIIIKPWLYMSSRLVICYQYILQLYYCFFITDYSMSHYHQVNQQQNTRPSSQYHQQSSQNNNQHKNNCQLCSKHHLILQRLDLLKTAILQKNQKIKQLQELISKISKMAFTSTKSQTYFNEDSVSNNHDIYVQQLTFSENVRLELNESHYRYGYAKFSANELELSASKSESLEKGLVEKDIIKRSIKGMRMEGSEGERQMGPVATFNNHQHRNNIGHRIQNTQSNVQSSKDLHQQQINQLKQDLNIKESPLRAKLLQIINILPSKINLHTLEYFKTQSEPMSQGMVGLVNSKISNHKIVKHSGFIKKNEKLSDQQPSLQSSSNYKKKYVLNECF